MLNSKRDFKQAPDDIQSYVFDRSEWVKDGESITTSVWSSDIPLTFTQATIDGTNTVVLIGDVDYEVKYVVYNTVTTSIGRRDTRTLRIYGSYE